MKVGRSLFGVILLFLGNAAAFETPNFFSVDVGQGSDEIKVYRIGYQCKFDRVFHESGAVSLSGYFEPSLFYWHGSNDDLYGAALSPVLTLWWRGDRTLKPYIEAGIGAALISKNTIDERDLSSAFQFEDRIGIGIESGDVDVHIRFEHYSNGSLVGPNDGMNTWTFGMGYRF